MKTTLYLLRHAATDGNLAQPEPLQGRRQDPPLSRLGVRQAEVTRNILAIRPVDQCYCSSLLRAQQTAAIVAGPHQLLPRLHEGLNECDIGAWEGLDWQAIRFFHADSYRTFLEDPGRFRYPGGESWAEIQQRVTTTLGEFFQDHPGQTILVVGHQLSFATYLAGLLNMTPHQILQIPLDNCGISVVVQENGQTQASVINTSLHIHGLAA